MDELRALAQLNPEIEAFYQKHWDEDILLGCILPWKPEAFEKLKEYGDGREELMTECVVLAVSLSSLGKLVNNWLPNFGKKVRWFMPHQLTHLEKEIAAR